MSPRRRLPGTLDDETVAYFRKVGPAKTLEIMEAAGYGSLEVIEASLREADEAMQKWRAEQGNEPEWDPNGPDEASFDPFEGLPEAVSHPRPKRNASLFRTKSPVPAIPAPYAEVDEPGDEPEPTDPTPPTATSRPYRPPDERPAPPPVIRRPGLTLTGPAYVDAPQPSREEPRR